MFVFGYYITVRPLQGTCVTFLIKELGFLCGIYDYMYCASLILLQILQEFKLSSNLQESLYYPQTHRLRSGAVPWRGRVEVKVNNTWGTVYDEHFELADANVACRATGFGSAIAVQNGSEYGRGIGPVHLRYASITSHILYLYKNLLRICKYMGMYEIIDLLIHIIG